jgi:alpha-1,2-mannosyltransferase
VRDDDISLLAAAWIAPLVARAVAGATGIPIGLITLVALYALVMRRVTKARTESMIGAAGVAQA